MMLPDENPAEIQPGRPICDPETLLRNIRWYGFGDMDDTKPYRFRRFGDRYGPNLYEFICDDYFASAGMSEASQKLLPDVTQQCLWAGNRNSGPDFGRILNGKVSKSALRPGRPDDRC